MRGLTVPTLLACFLLSLSQASTLTAVSQITSTTEQPERQSPEEVALTAINDTALTVTWKPPANATGIKTCFAHVDFSRKHNCTANENETTCTIASLSPYTNSTVVVRSCEEKVDGKRVCSAGITAFGHTLPSAPQFVTVAAKDDKTLTVTWKHPQDGNGIEAYRVCYHQKEEANAYNVDNNNKCQQTGLTESTEVTGLSPSTLYTVSVQSCDKMSTTEERICSSSVNASGYTKPSAPTGVNVTAVNDTALEVTWTKASIRAPTYEYFAYIKSSEMHRCTPTETGTNCTITSLSPYTAYAVVATSCFNPSKNNERICNDAEGVPGHTLPSAPVSLRLVAVTNTTIDASWSCLQEGDGPGTFLYTLSTSGDQKCQESCANGQVSCTVRDLSANTQYILTVTACDRKDPQLCSSQSAELLVYTKSGPPNNVGVGEVSATSIEMHWDNVAGSEEGLAGYLVNATPKELLRIESKECFSTMEARRCTVYDLEPETTYTIHVFAFRISTLTPLSLGVPISLSVTTGRLVPWLAILLGIFIPLILIILLVLAFVYRRKIPFLKDVVNGKGKPVDPMPNNIPVSPGPVFVIEYHEPPTLDYRSNAPPPIPTATLSGCIEDYNQSGGFNQLFMKLKEISVTELEKEYRLTKNAAEMNMALNRYYDMVPYDQSMVMLGHPWPEITENLKPQVAFAELETSYINASYIRRPRYSPNGGEATVAGADTPPEYIATQGPLQTTVVDFLTMVCEQKSPLIVMLCQTNEGGKPKCHKYWPDAGSQDFSSPNGRAHVTLLESEQSETWTRRKLRIEIPDKTKAWDVTQIHFPKWADYGVPPAEVFYSLVLAHVYVRKQCPLGPDYGPTVVHCSAGVGRTGTLIAGRFLLDQLRKNNQMTDIFGTVLAIRKWRANLVQTAAQLKFLYEFVRYCTETEQGNQQPTAPKNALPPPNTENKSEYMNIVSSNGPINGNAENKSEYMNIVSSNGPINGNEPKC